MPPARSSITVTALALSLMMLAISMPIARAQSADFDACLAFDRAACDKVLDAQPDNLTALFMRGLAAELVGDDAAALRDFDATATREARHFGAQLWRYVAAASLGQSRENELKAYLDGAQQLGAWPRALGEIYLGEVTPAQALALAGQQPGAAAPEAICAAEYHIGRLASLAGKADEATAHFRAALATGAKHVFEYQAAERALKGMP
jgi:lipoprotein NlpI